MSCVVLLLLQVHLYSLYEKKHFKKQKMQMYLRVLVLL